MKRSTLMTFCIRYSFLVLSIFLYQCTDPTAKAQSDTLIQKSKTSVSAPKVYTSKSTTPIPSTGFSTARAINQLANIENEYFNQYENGYSRYYGTVWAERTSDSSYFTLMKQRGIHPDSMHCTLYAMAALKAGFGHQYDSLEHWHQHYWKEREHAGWSIGYILVKHFNWKAYLILDSASVEFDRCMMHFQSHHKYPVWKQPDIPLEKVFIRQRDNSQIEELLSQHEFGWGFSYQGYHTWVTRYTLLKECYWAGAPTQNDDKPLFLKTPFLNFYDYNSHVVIFPP